MSALVRAVIDSSSRAGSMLKVSSSMSTKTGRAPCISTTFAVATHVKDGTITSSPGPMPSATSARCSAVVHDVVATACAAPV